MATIEEQIRRQLEGPKLGVNDLLADDKFSTVASYMEDRHGMTEEDHSREEIRDAFVNSMRNFNAGNTISVGKELNYLHTGDGAELTRRRTNAGSAYDLWDSLGGSFQEGATVGEKADAVGDYARAIILDPINAVSLGWGKLAGAGAMKASTQGLKVLAREAATAAGKDAARRGLKGTALQTVRREAAELVMSRGMREASYKQIARRGAVSDIVASGTVDVAAGVLADAGIQQADKLVGRREQYDPVQGAIAAVGGAAGAAMAGATVALRGTTSFTNSSLSLARSNETMNAAAKRLSDAKEAAKEVDPKKVQARLKEMLTPFQEYVEQGRFLKEADDPAWEVYEENLNVSFVKGVREILTESGIPIDRIESSLGQRRSGWLVDLVDSDTLPKEVKTQLQDFLDNTVGKVDNKSVDLVDYLKVNAERASQAGTTLQAQRMTGINAKLLGRTPAEITSEEALGAALGVKLDKGRENVQNWVNTGQQTFIRMLVTHPGTTALNVLGWAAASANQTYSDLLRGTLYGGTAALSGLVGKKATSAKYGRLAREMVRLQGTKIRNLADPMGTRDEVLNYLAHRPDAQDMLFRYLAGGVESDDIMKKLNLLPGETLPRTGLKKAFDALQTAYGVSAQDMLTKTQEFAYALDKQITIKYGMTFNDFMKQDNIADILTNRKTTSFKDYAKMEATAVEDTLRNVYAKKFGKRGSGRPIEFIANIIEEARNIPVIGALVPFGQFFNNTLGFMFDHTGVSLLHKIATGTSRDPLELVTKTAVGWTLIGAAAYKEMANLEEGLAWHEERNRDGSVVTRMYDYPVSFWKMAGRIWAHVDRDQAVPTGLVEEFIRNFGTEAVSRQLGDAATSVVEATKMLVTGEGDEAKEMFMNAGRESIGMYASGFTRFVDPVNSALAFAQGENYIEPTRAIGNKGLNNAIRYTDQVIDRLIGLENLPFDASGYSVEKKNAVTDRSMGSNPGRIAGYREVSPASSIQKLFNDVSRPQWQTELRTGNPEAQNIFNEYIFPFLEYHADTLVESGRWQSLPLAEKEKALTGLLSMARDDVKAILKNSTPGSDNKKASLIYEVNGQRSRGAVVFREVLRQFDVRDTELADLDEPQLELLLWFLKERQTSQKSLIDEILGKD